MTSSPLTQFLAVFDHPVVLAVIVGLVVVLAVAKLAKR
jgi:hypothetical protein